MAKAYNNFFRDPKHVGFPIQGEASQRMAYRRTTTTATSDSSGGRYQLPKWRDAARQRKTIPDDWKLKSATVEHLRGGGYRRRYCSAETKHPNRPTVHIVGLIRLPRPDVSSDGEQADTRVSTGRWSHG
ncbi:MAG: hypothetical protein ACLS6O_04150 [Bifidobacterium sp.]